MISSEAERQTRATETAPARLGVIDYLNVAPVYDWLERRVQTEGSVPGLELVHGVPAAMNAALSAGALDLSNVSSAAFGAHAHEWVLLPGLSVAAHQRVESVLLFSWHADWRALNGGSIALTTDSATSVELVRLLCEQRYGVAPRYVPQAPDLDAMLAQHDAALLIGDRALIEGTRRRTVAGRGQPYVFDLASEWHAWQGLPFVFAVWAARAAVAEAPATRAALALLRRSRVEGRTALDRIGSEAAARLGLPPAVCAAYLRLLDYDLTAHDLIGLRTFLEMARPGFRWADVRLLEDLACDA